MNVAVTSKQPKLRLLSFHKRHAATIEQWVETELQLRWLAPGTEMPLTAEKVLGWKRDGGQAFILARGGDPTPIGYAELNPMRREPGHLWLGHAIIRPDHRGRGIGQAFVRALVEHGSERLRANRVSLIVFPENTSAVNCYLRVGFVRVSEEYHEFGGRAEKHRLLRLVIQPPLSQNLGVWGGAPR